MKSAADRTKVVVRHLPPTITEAMLLEQIDDKFTRRFKFVSFRPGNKSLEVYSMGLRFYLPFHHLCSLLYIPGYVGEAFSVKTTCSVIK